MIKGSICREGIIVTNMYAINNRAPKYMKQKLTEIIKELDNSTIALPLEAHP
jgi:hypothetical protein